MVQGKVVLTMLSINRSKLKNLPMIAQCIEIYS
jgi:hypothetical protein